MTDVAPALENVPDVAPALENVPDVAPALENVPDVAPALENVPDVATPDTVQVVPGATVAPSDSLSTISGPAAQEARFAAGDYVVQARPDRFGPPGAVAVRYGVVLGVAASGAVVGWFGEVSPSVPEADIEAL